LSILCIYEPLTVTGSVATHSMRETVQCTYIYVVLSGISDERILKIVELMFVRVVM